MRNTPPEKLKWNWEEAIGLHGLAVLVPHLSQKLREESFDFIKRYQYFWDKKQPEISWADECPSVLSSFILGDDHPDPMLNFISKIGELIVYLEIPQAKHFHERIKLALYLPER